MHEEDEKEETVTDRRQRYVTNSNKRLSGGAGKLELEDVLVKFAGGAGDDGLHLYPHYQGETQEGSRLEETRQQDMSQRV